MKAPLLRADTGRVLVESHHGSSLGQANSWLAIESGHAAGADLIEVDVQTSRDGVAFLYHDYVLPDGRWTHTLSWAELREMAPAVHEFPRLEDVLSWARTTGAFLVLDVKSGFRPPGHVHGTAANMITAMAAEERVLLSDRDHHEVQAVKKAHPTLRTRAAIGARLTRLDLLIEEIRPDVITMRWDLCRQVDAELAHGMGVAVAFVDGWHPRYFEAAVHLGADILTWGDPAEARARLDAVPPADGITAG